MAGYSYLKDSVQKMIRKEAQKLLLEISTPEPPVLYDRIFEHEKLNIDLLTHENPKFHELVEEFGTKITDQLRGVLFVERQHILVRDDGYSKRNNFVYGHEIGHWRLSWHSKLLYKCTQFDLSQNARIQLEQEANLFSSELNFMGDTFQHYLMSSELSISHIKLLSDVFDMSREATIRRAVELHLKSCAYLTLTVNENSDDAFLTITYAVHSEPFRRDIGIFNCAQKFPKDHVIAKIVTDPLTNMVNRHECSLYFGEKKIELKAEVWNNKFNLFVLCQPISKS